jgi:hypothetical protein
MAFLVKNLNTIEQTWGGVTLEPSAIYELQPADLLPFAADDYFISCIDAGTAGVMTSSRGMLMKAEAISSIKAMTEPPVPSLPWAKVKAGKVVTIEEGQQMPVYKRLRIQDGGLVVNYGEIIIK